MVNRINIMRNTWILALPLLTGCIWITKDDEENRAENAQIQACLTPTQDNWNVCARTMKMHLHIRGEICTRTTGEVEKTLDENYDVQLELTAQFEIYNSSDELGDYLYYKNDDENSGTLNLGERDGFLNGLFIFTPDLQFDRFDTHIIIGRLNDDSDLPFAISLNDSGGTLTADYRYEIADSPTELNFTEDTDVSVYCKLGNFLSDSFI
jgi:hypothetical protein